MAFFRERNDDRKYVCSRQARRSWTQCIQLFRERFTEKMCTRQSRKEYMGYVQYTVPDTVAVEPTFVAFL